MSNTGRLVVLGVVGLIGASLIPIYVFPKAKPNTYHNIQKDSRKDIVQSEIQPGNMKIWSDPFDREKNED